jgi:hypothetical protein
MESGFDLTPKPENFRLSTTDENRMAKKLQPTSPDGTFPVSKLGKKSEAVGGDQSSLEPVQPKSHLSDSVPDRMVDWNSETVHNQHSQVELTDDLRCPECNLLLGADELACINCGAVFSNEDETHRLHRMDAVRLARARYVGKAVADDVHPIVLQIAGDAVILPMSSTVIVGRSVSSLDSDNTLPDIDLKQFKAHINGVSRQHVRITRDSDLVHITDLGSTNGTFLNGFRLLPHQERVLRNGDELVLGRLKTYVRF